MQTQTTVSRTPRKGRSRLLGVPGALVLCAALAGSFAAFAAASGGSVVSAAHNSRLRASILVNGQGRTLYVLSPESTHHLLCTSSSCLATWPPLTVSRSTHLTEGGGVHGKLGELRRSNGSLQVTLNGLPLYLFVGDSGRGEATGEGLKSFGGTWHAVLASGRPR